jgi:hypothetical protein
MYNFCFLFLFSFPLGETKSPVKNDKATSKSQILLSLFTLFLSELQDKKE